MPLRPLARGQALVEFALVMPVLMFLLLGFGEVAFLVATQHRYQNAVDVMAQWAAVSMAENGDAPWSSGWQAVASSESARVGCSSVPAMMFPDGTHDPGDRVHVRWSCRYSPHLVSMLEVTVTVDSVAVVPFVPSATPTPEPS